MQTTFVGQGSRPLQIDFISRDFEGKASGTSGTGV